VVWWPVMLRLRSTRSALLSLGAFAVISVGFASEASAFCRSTTCTGDCARDENECKTTGEPLYWASSCVSFSLQQDSSIHIPMKYFEQAAQRSFVAWTDLECETGLATVAFSQLDDVACHKTEYNKGGTNANIIMFQDNKWVYQGVDNTLAKTTVTFDGDTGEILDADIEINHANNNFTISDMVIEYDLESVLTHEVGHFIGLDHTLDFSATMYAGYEPGTIEQRSLEEDDVLGACEIYPPERQASCDTAPRGGLGYECGGVANGEDGGDEGEGCSSCRMPAGNAGSGWGLALLAGLALTFRLRARRGARQ
jgi:hypothetical protein